MNTPDNYKDHYTYDEMFGILREFKEILKIYSIDINEESDLALKYQAVNDLIDCFKREVRIDKKIRIDANGVYEFVLKIVAAHRLKDHEFNSQLLPHLSKMNNASIAQNQQALIRGDVRDENSNKMIELFIACMCKLAGATKILLDSPDNAKGNNPDILADFGKTRWGFACKTISSRSPQTFYSNIVKAIDQIEKSDAQVGVPIINLKNILAHDLIYQDQKLSDFKKILCSKNTTKLHDNAYQLVSELINHPDIKELFNNKPNIPAIVFIGQSVCLLLENQVTVSTALSCMIIETFDQNINDEDVESVLVNLYDEMFRKSYQK